VIYILATASVINQNVSLFSLDPSSNCQDPTLTGANVPLAAEVPMAAIFVSLMIKS
jgi:hypothetical protein